MNTPITLSPDNPTVRINSVEHLITEGLGYCCEGFFWAAYLDVPAPLIGARLGVTAATINRHKSDYRGKLHKCTKKPNCMIDRRKGIV